MVRDYKPKVQDLKKLQKIYLTHESSNHYEDSFDYPIVLSRGSIPYIEQSPEHYLDESEYDPYCEKAQLFKAKFIALLESDHMYNLDKKGDFRKVYGAMLAAYRDTVDSDILFKIQHLKHNGVGFNIHFLQEVANLIKNSLI